MVALNFTVVVEMFLFLVFLWITNKFFFRRLLRVMDARDAKLNEDKTAASSDKEEAQRLEAEYVRRLTEADQAAAQRLRQVRYEGYQHNRDQMDKLRRESDTQIAVFRDELQSKLDEERRHYGELVGGLVKTMDEWVARGGSVL